MYQFEFFRDRENRIICETQEALESVKHFHNCLEFIYCINGEAYACIDETEYHFSSGQICAIPCFSTHFYRMVRNGEFLVCLIPRRYFRESDHVFNSNSFKNPIMTDPEPKPLLGLFRQIRNIAYDRDIWGEPLRNVSADRKDLQLYHLSSFLVDTFIQYCGLYERKRISALVAEAICVIETHFKEDINVSYVCDVLNCNQKELSMSFKKALNMSILDYIERTRLTEASLLLRKNPGLTNEQVMLESGYQSPRTFLRHFKETYHCTPSEYKIKYAKTRS